MLTRLLTSRDGRARRIVAKVDPFLVRYVGWSWMSHVATRAKGTPYVQTLLLQTFDPRTGARHQTPVFYGRLDDLLVVVGSRGGSPKDPRWVRNLRSNPEAVVWIRRKRLPVRAVLLEGAERESAWRVLTSLYPAYDEYRQRAAEHRQLPVFALTPEAPVPAPG